MAQLEIERGCRRGQSRLEAALMNVDPDPPHYKCPPVRFALGFNQDSTCFARPDQQVVGPAQVYAEPGHNTDGVRSRQTRSQRNQRQECGGKLGSQQDTGVEALAGRRAPRMIAAPAAGGLLIGKIDRTLGCPVASGRHGIAVGGSGDREEVHPACVDRTRKLAFQGGEIVHFYSAVMVMEISAALAEWVSAPTLMKSTPVSANWRIFSSTIPPDASVGIPRLSRFTRSIHALTWSGVMLSSSKA